MPINEANRLDKWKIWWERIGKHNPNSICAGKEVNLPDKTDALAEFIGIAMGDGGMSQYQVRVSLNTTDDSSYIQFVSGLMCDLFEVAPALYQDSNDNVTDLVISRKVLVDYLHNLGLPIGDKIRNGLDMPDWIKESQTYAIACVRGLIDTDGCVFTHRYSVKGKSYAYKKLSFTSASPPLLETVYEILSCWEMKPRMGSNHDVRLESSADVRKYFELIGSHNPKHLRRYEN
jgi:hypothetical protein